MTLRQRIHAGNVLKGRFRIQKIVLKRVTELETKVSKLIANNAVLKAERAVLKAENAVLMAKYAVLNESITKLLSENTCRAAEIADLKGNMSKVQYEIHALCLDK